MKYTGHYIVIVHNTYVTFYEIIRKSLVKFKVEMEVEFNTIYNTPYLWSDALVTFRFSRLDCFRAPRLY